MVFLASFIGIDRHIDPAIPELSGARRDALALDALFRDSVPDICARLLVNSQATVKAIRQTLDITLGSATPDDTVILSFSGHGTRSHQIVAHDTLVASLSDTTIPMEELARRFKDSKAKIIFFLLDCCFSGGAPARVLEHGPIARMFSGLSLEALTGEGRVLLAAAKDNQEAYEVSGGGHGLLTKAFIECLRQATKPVNVLHATGQIMEHVQGEAARMGVVQTPVLLGEVKGGLVLPPLRSGELFLKAFPEHSGIQIKQAIAELSRFGLPPVILAEWERQFPEGFRPLQLQAINNNRVLDGKSLLVVSPTGSGKTFIGEVAAVKTVCSGKKAVFLLPYRALTSEKYEQFDALYRECLNMRVIRCSGDYSDQTDLFVKGKYDLALLTYEMFLNLIVGNPSTLNHIGLVVLDEAQFITDPLRGINVELLLTYLLTAQQKGSELQLIALSAVVGNINDFDKWLGCEQLVVHERPVPLVEGVLDRSGIFQYLDVDGQAKATQFLPPEAIQVRKAKPKSQDVIVPLVQQLVQQGEKVIIFRNQKGSAQGCAKYLSDELHLAPATDIVELLPTSDLPTTSTLLRHCLRGGSAFHNKNLTREEKAVIEQAFRDPAGAVHVLAATTTLAAGINTPASTVILAEQSFIGEDGRPFTVAEYKNMAGRAGRPGFDHECGKAIILATHAQEREQLFQSYVMGQLEPLRSCFDPTNLKTWVLRLLAQRDRIPCHEVVVLLANTFGGYLASRRTPGWQAEMQMQVESVLQDMMSDDLVEQEGEYVQLTLLGRIFGASALSFDSAMRLVRLLRNEVFGELTIENLLALVQTLPESDGGYTPMMKRGQSEAIRPRQVAEKYGSATAKVLQRYVKPGFLTRT